MSTVEQDAHSIIKSPSVNRMGGLRFIYGPDDGTGHSTIAYNDESKTIDVEVKACDRNIQVALISHALAKLDELGFMKMGYYEASDDEDQFRFRFYSQDRKTNEVWSGSMHEHKRR